MTKPRKLQGVKWPLADVPEGAILHTKCWEGRRGAISSGVLLPYTCCAAQARWSHHPLPFWILTRDWSIQVTWPGYWLVIGPYWSRDLCLWPPLVHLSPGVGVEVDNQQCMRSTPHISRFNRAEIISQSTCGETNQRNSINFPILLVLC